MSDDLVWEIIKNESSFLVKRKTYGGVRFSREPLNLANKHAKKYSGLANSKAIGVEPSSSGRGVTLSTRADPKKTLNAPSKNIIKSAYRPNKSSRSVAHAIVNTTTKRGYRSDLRREALARASAILKTQKEKGTRPERKARGRKAGKDVA